MHTTPEHPLVGLRNRRDLQNTHGKENLRLKRSLNVEKLTGTAAAGLVSQRESKPVTDLDFTDPFL